MSAHVRALWGRRASGPAVAAVALEHDVLYPRDDQHRYRLYARRGLELTVLACAPDPGGIGNAIVTFDEDVRRAGGSGLGDMGATGVFDTQPGEPVGRWVVSPWHRSRP